MFGSFFLSLTKKKFMMVKGSEKKGGGKRAKHEQIENKTEPLPELLIKQHIGVTEGKKDIKKMGTMM